MQLFYAKNSSKKLLIFEKWETFENCQKWPPTKAYSLCKIVTLGQKLKMQEKMLKTFLQHIAVVLCKKRLQKTPNIRKMRAFWKLLKWPPTKRYSLCQILTLGQKLKMQKNMLERFYDTLQMFYAKNGSKKQLIFKKWDHFENCQKWSPTKSYSLCKILTLRQKWKMQKNMLKRFLQHVAVVLCKKQLQKTPNIRKMRDIWKLPKMATNQSL